MHPALIDPFTHRAFGAQVAGQGLRAVHGSNGLALTTATAGFGAGSRSRNHSRSGAGDAGAAFGTGDGDAVGNSSSSEEKQVQEGPLVVEIKLLTLLGTTSAEWLSRVEMLASAKPAPQATISHHRSTSGRHKRWKRGSV